MTDFFAYLAWNRCGCVAGMIVDDPEDRRTTAKFVAKAVRDGRTIERVRWSGGPPGFFGPCRDNPDCERRKKP